MVLFFAAIVSAEDVERGKPDPQVFLIAASRLGLAPERCVVVEDAHAGIEAGRRAGMQTIGVRTTHADLEADWAVATMADLPADGFLSLTQRRKDAAETGH
ncbi:MAG: HAD family hydrolase [Chloroflexaceae bacterium]|nr:HAD family hydrolase [Chloroflexaceae bacterium]